MISCDKTNLTNLGNNLLLIEQTASTNSHLRQLVEANQNLSWGTGLMAHCQTQGRGRSGRRWISPPGNLTCSFWFSLKLDLVAPLPLVAGLAVVDLLRSYGVDQAVLKWPNDVLCQDRKVAGILCETVVSEKQVLGSIVGLGLNLTSQAIDLAGLSRPALGLASITGQPISPEEAFHSLAVVLRKRIAQLSSQGFRGLAQEWYSCCGHRQAWVAVRQGAKYVRGLTVGLGDSGQLLLAQASCQEIPAGEHSWSKALSTPGSSAIHSLTIVPEVGQRISEPTNELDISQCYQVWMGDIEM